MQADLSLRWAHISEVTFSQFTTQVIPRAVKCPRKHMVHIPILSVIKILAVHKKKHNTEIILF